MYIDAAVKSIQLMGHEKIDMTLGIYADARIDNNSIVNTMNNFWK